MGAKPPEHWQISHISFVFLYMCMCAITVTTLFLARKLLNEVEMAAEMKNETYQIT